MKNFSLLKLRLIDLIGGLSIYKVLDQIREEQYLPKEKLDRMREEKLEALFALAKKSAPYYASFKNVAELPVLTKKIIRQQPDAFLSNTYTGKLIKKSTSGSTGTPLDFYSSAQAQSYLWAGLLLCWEVTGYRFGDKVAFIAGNALIKKGLKHSIFYKLMNITVYPASIVTDEAVSKYISSMKEKKIKLIYGYATTLNVLADYILKNGIAPPADLHGIVSTAELLSDKIRANIERAFGVKVFNQYGCNEAGISAFECEHHQLHLISSRCKYETSAKGTLISTDLANDAYILMKYNSGDIVEFSDKPCSCGRRYPVIKSLEGREDDVVIDRKHKTIHCAFFFYLFKDDSYIRQYQVFFDETSICINLTVDGHVGEKHYQHYLDYIKENLDFEQYEIQVNQEFVTKKNLKHSFIIDERTHAADIVGNTCTQY
jgi:phenylacetate-CoA ligase